MRVLASSGGAGLGSAVSQFFGKFLLQSLVCGFCFCALEVARSQCVFLGLLALLFLLVECMGGFVDLLVQDEVVIGAGGDGCCSDADEDGQRGAPDAVWCRVHTRIVAC